MPLSQKSEGTFRSKIRVISDIFPGIVFEVLQAGKSHLKKLTKNDFELTHKIEML